MTSYLITFYRLFISCSSKTQLLTVIHGAIRFEWYLEQVFLSRRETDAPRPRPFFQNNQSGNWICCYVYWTMKGAGCCISSGRSGEGTIEEGARARGSAAIVFRIDVVRHGAPGIFVPHVAVDGELAASVVADVALLGHRRRHPTQVGVDRRHRSGRLLVRNRPANIYFPWTFLRNLNARLWTIDVTGGLLNWATLSSFFSQLTQPTGGSRSRPSWGRWNGPKTKWQTRPPPPGRRSASFRSVCNGSRISYQKNNANDNIRNVLRNGRPRCSESLRRLGVCRCDRTGALLKTPHLSEFRLRNTTPELSITGHDVRNSTLASPAGEKLDESFVLATHFHVENWLPRTVPG